MVTDRYEVLTVVGARPQFVKAAPVGRLLRQQAHEFLVHTGQHYDESMSQVFFAELGITKPDVDLAIGSESHGAQTGRMLEALEKVILERKPDLVVVYGDTNTTLAGALAAAKLNVPVAHVEAGLRSGRRDMPEEINRVVADHVATLLFCPTQTAVGLLRREGITEGVSLVGDVMADALAWARPRITPDRARALANRDGEFYVATIHRAENTDDAGRLRRALALLASVPGTVVLPVHPRTAAAVAAAGFRYPPNAHVIDSVGYLDMMSLVANSRAVLTDSGGLQKEAVMLGTQCLTLRGETEWPETLEGGWNTLIGLDSLLLAAALEREPVGRIDAFAPGASARVVRVITEFLAGDTEGGE